MNNDPMCLNCGYFADLEEGEENDYGHTDTAHYPNWSSHPSEELDIMNALINDTYTEVTLQDTGRYPCRQCSRVSGHKLDCTEGM